METNLEDLADKAIFFASQAGCEYCDVRAEVSSLEGVTIENGEIEYTITSTDRGIGIRLLNSGAWGFCSLSQPKLENLRNAIEDAVKTAKYYSEQKNEKIKISNFKANKDRIDYPVLVEPTIDELIKIGFDCDKIIQTENRIIKSVIDIGYSKISKYFVNTEGSKIHQNHTDIIVDLSATANESGITQSVNITEGGRGGIEKILKEKNTLESAKFVAEKASQLIEAKPAKEEKATVVMNPDFVGLLTHEILGHPSEADRVLGKEMAWAGGAWWAGKIGEKIGSDNLNVFDDPTIEGSLGWYKYDDEGIKSSKTNLIENGKLTHHLQNRETAEIFNENPTANMRASSYRFMPLIRMACTCIGKGEWDPDEMIKGVKNGYLISNMKIPSIDMKRYNWSISCQYAQKIENGEIAGLLRDVIVLGTAPDFFQIN